MTNQHRKTEDVEKITSYIEYVIEDVRQSNFELAAHLLEASVKLIDCEHKQQSAEIIPLPKK